MPLTSEAIADVARRVATARPAGVSVCFLHAYAHPAHEQLVAEACRDALPGAYVVCSSEVWPEMREFERAMTTAVCALVGPVMAGYVAGLESRLRDIGIECSVEIMESSGGVMSAPIKSFTKPKAIARAAKASPSGALTHKAISFAA